MTTPDGTRLVIDVLNALGVPYMVVGSFSSMAYGEVRATLDADFVIQSDAAINDVRDRLKPHFVMDSQIGFETKLMTTKYVFTQRDTNFKVELFLLSEDPHDQMRFARRIETVHQGLRTYLPRAEDVIIQKLRWRRKKDRDDIRGILRVSGLNLDWDYLRNWTLLHGTDALLDELSAPEPPM